MLRAPLLRAVLLVFDIYYSWMVTPLWRETGTHTEAGTDRFCLGMWRCTILSPPYSNAGACWFWGLVALELRASPRVLVTTMDCTGLHLTVHAQPHLQQQPKHPISSRIPCSPLTVHLPWVLRSTPSKGILSSTNTKTPSFRSEESLRFDNMPIVPTYHHKNIDHLQLRDCNGKNV